MDSVHPLSAWLDRTGTRQTDFAKTVGCSDGFLSLVLRDLRGLSLARARKIEEATGGEVTAEQLRCRPIREGAAA